MPTYKVYQPMMLEREIEARSANEAIKKLQEQMNADEQYLGFEGLYFGEGFPEPSAELWGEDDGEANRDKCVEVLGVPMFGPGDRVRIRETAANDGPIEAGMLGEVVEIRILDENDDFQPESIENPDPASDQWWFIVQVENGDTNGFLTNELEALDEADA